MNNLEVTLKIQILQTSTLRETNDIILAIKRFPNVTSVQAQFGDEQEQPKNFISGFKKNSPNDGENIERNFANE